MRRYLIAEGMGEPTSESPKKWSVWGATEHHGYITCAKRAVEVAKSYYENNIKVPDVGKGALSKVAS